MKTGSIGFMLENLTHELSSDHSPILLDIPLNSTHTYPPKPLFITNWETFKEEMGYLSLPFEKIRSKLQIDNLIEQLTSTISQKLKTSSSIFTAQDRKNDLPTFIQKQIKKKRTLRAVWQRTRDPIVKRALNNQTSLVRDLLQAHKGKEWTTFLGSIDNDAQELSKLHKLNRRLLRKPPPIHPLEDQDGHLQFDPEAKADLFAQSMEDQFSSPDTHC